MWTWPAGRCTTGASRWWNPSTTGRARVEGRDGSLSVIDERGTEIIRLREPATSTLQELSGDMVGVWKTQAIRAAAELGVFESAAGIARRRGAGPGTWRPVAGRG